MRPFADAAPFRFFPLDGAALWFDRETGWNVHAEGPETAHLRQRAPRVVQFGITNRCSLACGFCSRDPGADSAWTPDGAFDLLAGLDERGVLEVAFGGGEPWTFPGFADLVVALHERTRLAVGFTTNGLALDERRLAAIAGRHAQVRLSLYDENDWPARVELLARCGARFGVNWLVTPANLHELETRACRLLSLGCRDLLLLRYKGDDASLHLGPAALRDFASRVAALARALPRMQVGLDVCWGAHVGAIPGLRPAAARPGDCGAGRDSLVVTSDRRVSPCSFHHESEPVTTADDVIAAWRRAREMEAAATRAGCARAEPVAVALGAAASA